MEENKRDNSSSSRLQSVAVLVGFTVLVIGGLVLTFYVISITNQVHNLRDELNRLQISKIDTKVMSITFYSCISMSQFFSFVANTLEFRLQS